MRGRAPGGPERDSLVEVRRRFFRLHKTLIDAERAVYERRQGRSLGSGEFLQALIQDDYFDWLRPFSALIVEMDEALASREPLSDGLAAAFVQRMEELTADGSSGPGARYPQLTERDPGVLLAHIELRAALAAAKEEST